MRNPTLLLALSLFASGCASKDEARAARDSARTGDSAFARVQLHGAMVMGVDQYTSKHRFEPLPDGGRIVLQREAGDTTGVATIRKHMREIAVAFAAGDFKSPETVHSMTDVPGTRVMRRLRAAISYAADDIPGGGEVRIVTRNPEAVAAVHEFLAFQRRDHRAGM